MTISRRALCRGAAIGALLAKTDAAFAMLPDDRPYSGATLARSGNEALDQAVIIVLMKITSILGINPGFRFIEDDTSLAIRESLVPGTRGTVLLGIPLLKRALKEFGGGPIVAFICSHECGYIFQFQNGFVERIDSQNRSRVTGLFADYIAGYCMGKLQFQQYSFTAPLAQFMVDSNNRSNSSLVFQARMVAVEKGFAAATLGVPLRDAANQGFLFANAMN